jgi:hypothetical protein
LVASPVGLMIMFYCFTALGAYRPLTSLYNVGRSVKVLLVFASTVIPDFSLLEIHYKDLYSLLDMYVFRNGASSSTKEVLVFLREFL